MADDPLRSLVEHAKDQIPGASAGGTTVYLLGRLLGRLRPQDHPPGSAWVEHEDGWPWKRKVLCQNREDGTVKVTPLRPDEEVPEGATTAHPGRFKLLWDEVQARLKRGG